VLIVAPPSETKRPPPDDGAPVDLAALSFPELTPLRQEVIGALLETSAGADAFRRLRLRSSFAADIARNMRVLELPAMAAADLYTGPLHRGLDLATLAPEARERAADAVVITSPVWGALRPDDRLPTYRLDLFAHLVGLDRLDHVWRTAVREVLERAAGPDGVVVDLRSGSFRQIGRTAGLPDRTVALRVAYQTAGGRIGDVVAKRMRGQAARHLLETGLEPVQPDDVADRLGDRWPVELEPPPRPGYPWTLTLRVDP
jgi:cytoplasmic iron level regulating protein YaaA (DUF328/UPF0246 family)